MEIAIDKKLLKYRRIIPEVFTRALASCRDMAGLEHQKSKIIKKIANTEVIKVLIASPADKQKVEESGSFLEWIDLDNSKPHVKRVVRFR